MQWVTPSLTTILHFIMKIKAILLLLAFFIYNPCFPQTYPFINYSPKDGLINNRTRQIYQDRHGLLYVVTYGGLSVYDGSRFTNYTSGNGLPTNTLNDIMEMGDDTIWVVPNAASVFTLINGRLKKLLTSDGFCPVINKMFRSSDGTCYALADEGLFKYENNKFTRVQLKGSDGRDAGGFFKNIVERNNRLYLITDPNIQSIAGPGRLLVFDIKTKQLIINSDPIAYFIAISPAGDILLSTRFGIKALDEKALLQNKISFGLPPQPYTSVSGFVSNYMYFDRQQNFWICTSGGILKIDKLGHVKKFTASNGLTTDSQSSIFQDKENTIWFTNEQTGISKLVNPQFEFYYRIKPGFLTTDIFTENRSDSVWFLDGVHCRLLLQYKNRSEEFRLEKPVAPPYRFFYIGGNKNYLTDLFNVYECRLTGNKASLKIIHSSDSIQNINLAFSFLQSDHRNNLILISAAITALMPDNKSYSYPLGYFADACKVTPQSHLWVATRGNTMFEFDIHPDNTAHYFTLLHQYNSELPKVSPRSITVDQTGNVWVGTRDNGLFCFLFDSSRSIISWRQITINDGLSDNFINYLFTDSDGSIWACSQGGMDRIKFNSGHYLIENITRSNNVYQYISKVQTSKGNVHWALTGGSVIKISPDSAGPPGFQPAIMLRTVHEGVDPIDVKNAPISLSYKQNNLRFSMAVPSFIDEQPIRYSYLLLGSGEKKWSEPSTQTILNFAGLAPGNYILKAKAHFINGRYQDSETSFSFNILPPWWQRWWFKAIAVCMTLVLIVYAIRSYYQGKIKKQRFEFEKKEAIKHERTRIATDMHDDLGAGLARIRFLSESIRRKKPEDPSYLPEIIKISSFSDEMIEKMGEIVWAMNEKNDTMADLFAFTRSYAADYLHNHGISYDVELPHDSNSLSLSGESRRTIFSGSKRKSF